MVRILCGAVFVFVLFNSVIGSIKEETSLAIHNGLSVANINISKGGKVSITNREEFPYVAALEYSGDHVCGAVIVRANAVITAAQCLEVYTEIPFLEVRAGGVFAVDLGSQTTTVQVVRVRKFRQHPDFRKDIPNNNDIAIVWTYKNFIFTSAVQAINLARPEMEPFAGVNGIVLGWGKTEKGKNSNVLLKGTVQVFSKNLCKLVHKKNYIAANMICAGDLRKKVTPCDADAGGPLVLYNPKEYSSDILIGLISFKASRKSGPCNPFAPAIFTKISAFQQWVANA